MTDVLLDRVGTAGRIVLNRPKALNALTHDMARLIHTALTDWVDDRQVQSIVINGAGERGLCAGGDIRSIYEDLSAGGTATLDFWRDEYHLNAAIGRYPKPFVAMMDGLVMGGGVGLSGHAAHRIVTERSAVAMPEVGIGLIPDVGGTWLLANAPGELGLYAALSGARLDAGDAIALRMADWFVPADRLPGLIAALTAIPESESDPDGAVGALIQEVALPSPAGSLETRRDWIDDCFSADTAEEIVARLAASGVADAEDTAKEIGRKSPTSVKVTLEAVRRARGFTSLEEAQDQEFRLVSRCFAAPDLAEGIRAQVIDKDRDPHWLPAVLEQVSDDRVAGFFAPLDDELGLSEGEQR
jgi:enoyl-CoA hydratase